MELASTIATQLDGLAIPAKPDEVVPGRPNVVATLRGRGAGRSLSINAHMHMVGIQGMTAPFAATVRAGRLIGRGHVKGSIAAMMAAAKTLQEPGTRLAGDVIRGRLMHLFSVEHHS